MRFSVLSPLIYSTEIFSPLQQSCFLENNLTAHAHVACSARTDFPFLLHGLFADFFSPFALACVASVSVRFRSKERPRKGIFLF